MQNKQTEKSTTAMYFIWFTIVFFVLSLGYIYIGWRLIVPAKLPAAWNMLAWSVLAVLFLLPVLSSSLMRFYERITDPFSWLAYSGLGFISLIITFLLARDLLWLAGNVLEKGYIFIYRFFSTNPPPSLVDIKQRELILQISNLVVLAVSVIFTFYGMYEARRKPEIVRVTIPVSGLAQNLNGFRIVQISDIHAGLTVKRDWIESITAEVRNLNPDLIAFTGDLADGTVNHLSAEVVPLGTLQAPCGKYFVTGNHEYFTSAESWIEEVKRLGFDVLINEHRVINYNGSSFVLAGVTDPSARYFLPEHKSNPQVALGDSPSSVFRILLAHQPNALYRASKLGFNLVISGHTHGGQFFPWNFVAALGQPYITGLHLYDGTWIYVSRGTGYWGPPLRLGARSEITVITLEQSINQNMKGK